jgi:hypothetical protein
MVLPLNSQKPPKPPDNTGPAAIIALAIVLAALIVAGTMAYLYHDAQDQAARAVQQIDRATRGAR